MSDTGIALEDVVSSSVIQQPVSHERPLILSLFSGAGGLDLGFWQAGYKIVLAADIFPTAVSTHIHNHKPHGTVTKNLDLSSTTYEQLSSLWFEQTNKAPVGIIGGPPCQAFSVSNVYQRDDDPRRFMLERYAQFVEGFNGDFGIDFFLLENVPGLLDEKHEGTSINLRVYVAKQDLKFLARLLMLSIFVFLRIVSVLL